MPASRNAEQSTDAIASIDQLEQYFHDGCKEPDAWQIGVEYEKPVVTATGGDATPYEGPRGIGAVLAALRERSGWSEVHEGDSLIALRGEGASITLEPGGQLEMSGRLCDSLHCANDELLGHVADVVAVGEELGLAFLGLGITPRTELAGMPWMPKQRYHVMREIMKTTGTLGHRMMQQTATVQANFDYRSEPDAHLKFRLSMAMSPMLIAMSANSPVVDGRLTSYKSYRAHVWRDTDADRCGVLPFAFDTDNLFGAYTQYALDVPMYFVCRGNDLLPSGGRTFRDFLTHGLDGQHSDGVIRATIDDWATHLTTLFPEARLKTYIEVRAADAQSVPLMLATPALMKGLLYDDDCLRAAWDVVAAWSLDKRMGLGEEAARDGLQARAGRHSLHDYARDLVGIAAEGLRRQELVDGDGRDESVYLEPLAADVADGVTPADRIVALWTGAWAGNVERLVEHATYRQA